MEVNELEPDIVVCSGDLTTFGFQQEYAEAKTYLDRLECENVVVVPGNHDSRNAATSTSRSCSASAGARSRWRGHGRRCRLVRARPRQRRHRRGRYPWIEEQFAAPADFRIFVLHHHLLPVPGTGRERNVVYDAGDALEVLSTRASTWSSPDTSTSRTRGGSRTSSSSTPARFRHCA